MFIISTERTVVGTLDDVPAPFYQCNKNLMVAVWLVDCKKIQNLGFVRKARRG
jgi:hypothetical protein